MAQSKKTKQKRPPAKVVNYLEKMGVSHDILEHKTVYTAIDAANTLKKKLNQIAKSLLVKADKDYYLVLLPADKNLNEEKLKKLISKQKGKEVKTVKIPGEKIMAEFLKIKEGALSAFGKVHKLPVIVDKELEKTRKAIFPSGGFNHSVEMTVKDFLKLEGAISANVGNKKKVKTPKKNTGKKTTSKASPKKKTATPKKKPATAKKKTTTTKKAGTSAAGRSTAKRGASSTKTAASKKKTTKSKTPAGKKTSKK